MIEGRTIVASETRSKLDAACRQLNTAILLWFAEGDPVSIHMLACSAYQIVHDCNTHHMARICCTIAWCLRMSTAERWAIVSKKGTIFKHADKDPAGMIEFDSAITEVFILFTSGGLEMLGKQPDEIRGRIQCVLWTLEAPVFD